MHASVLSDRCGALSFFKCNFSNLEREKPNEVLIIAGERRPGHNAERGGSVLRREVQQVLAIIRLYGSLRVF